MAFTFTPQRTQLIVGDNGAGKSAVFDVLWRLRQLIAGERRLSHPTETPFPTTSLTRWDLRQEQSFELEVEGNGGVYEYKLILHQKPDIRKSQIHSEILNYNGKPLLTFVDGEITIYREDQRVGAQFGFDWSQSALITLHEERKDNRLHRWFRDWIGRIQLVCANPFDMVSDSAQESPRLNQNATNFVSWYRHVTDDIVGLEQDVRQSLGELWEGFRGMRLESVGPNVKLLKAVFEEPVGTGGGSYEVAFGDMSDGQRVLVALYTLLRFSERKPGSVICIDEPDNFVTLAEIQPWLMSICQAAEDHESQVLLISHHPELINYLAPHNAVVLRRADGGPTRVMPFRASTESTMTPAEIIARGWEGE